MRFSHSVHIVIFQQILKGFASLRGPGAVNVVFFDGNNLSNVLAVDTVTLQYPFLYFGASMANMSDPFNTDFSARPLNWKGPYAPVDIIDTVGMPTTESSVAGLWGGDCVYDMP